MVKFSVPVFTVRAQLNVSFRLLRCSSLKGPLLETCEGRNATNHLSHVWASTLCPLENECLNGRHNCNMTTQVCVDVPESFKCVCKPGYNDTGNPG